ncbi:hypothetical protein LWI29_020589 [Acer saccharum]|uniref:RNase H type-1 domain-containing protein n=1 Tax=Acer saccharum TaxID=4024 RepID=A0AA39RUQ7_ACESA|nr:hypothetical protein LWI29_020589 [Acer saccharum]
MNEFSFEGGHYWVAHHQQLFELYNAPMTKLRLIKIKGFKYEDHEIKLVKCLLQAATSLETLILVSTTGYRATTPALNLVMLESNLHSWKSSPNAEIKMYHADRNKYNSADVVSGVFPKTPVADRSVCNVDAAVTHGSGKCGIGIIFRDVSGMIVDSAALIFRGVFSVEVAEARVIFEGLSMAVSASLSSKEDSEERVLASVSSSSVPRNFNINLQEDALDRIISFSPVKIGMKTTILSTRFQHSWKKSRILYNGEINIYKGGRSCFQSPFRSNHPNPSTEVHSNRSRKLCSQMDRKVRGEESRGVELDFLYATVQFELSPEFFNVESLRMVKINHCAVELLPLLKGSTFLNSLLQKRTA